MFLLRKNDYKHDPLQGGWASNAIASRYDLNDVYGGVTSQLFGATDAKVTSYRLHKFDNKLFAVVISKRVETVVMKNRMRKIII